MATHTGGCLCGAIRYEITGEPVRAAHCHCDECRRATGSSFATVAFFKEEDVKVIQGTPKQFFHPADSGNTMTKEFCGNCGSHFLSGGPGYEGLEFIKAGTLDDASWAVPQAHIWCEEKLEWLQLPEGAEPIARNPG